MSHLRPDSAISYRWKYDHSDYSAERRPFRISEDQLVRATAIAIDPDEPLDKIRLLCQLVAALED